MYLLKRLLIAAIISIALMSAFVPFNFWLLDSVGHLPQVNRETANRNFVATVVNQSLQLVTISLVLVMLSVIVRIMRSIPVIDSKQAFKDMHPKIPDHYLDSDQSGNADKYGTTSNNSK